MPSSSRLIKTVVLAGIILSGGVLAFRVFTDHEIGFSLDKSSVSRGEEFTLRSTFHNSRGDDVRPDGEVSIIDETMKNRFISTDDLKKASERGTVRELRSGFVARDDWQCFHDGFLGSCPVEGCTSTYGEERGRPPLRTEIEGTIIVLPDTPPGRYKVLIPAHRFCEETNAATVLEVTVQR